MKFSFILITSFLFCFGALSAQAESAIAAKVDLSLGANQSSIAIEATKEGLMLGQTRLEPWPYDVPVCDNCELTITRSFSPVGPSVTVLLTSTAANQPSWFFADLLRPNEQLPNGAVARTRGNMVIIEKGNTTIELAVSEQKQLDGCQYQLTWLETNNAQTKQNGTQQIIAEDPTIRTQIVALCRP